MNPRLPHQKARRKEWGNCVRLATMQHGVQLEPAGRRGKTTQLVVYGLVEGASIKRPGRAWLP
jgi:hypothetical protein